MLFDGDFTNKNFSFDGKKNVHFIDGCKFGFRYSDSITDNLGLYSLEFIRYREL